MDLPHTDPNHILRINLDKAIGKKLSKYQVTLVIPGTEEIPFICRVSKLETNGKIKETVEKNGQTYALGPHINYCMKTGAPTEIAAIDITGKPRKDSNGNPLPSLPSEYHAVGLISVYYDKVICGILEDEIAKKDESRLSGIATVNTVGRYKYKNKDTNKFERFDNPKLSIGIQEVMKTVELDGGKQKFVPTGELAVVFNDFAKGYKEGKTIKFSPATVHNDETGMVEPVMRHNYYKFIPTGSITMKFDWDLSEARTGGSTISCKSRFRFGQKGSYNPSVILVKRSEAPPSDEMDEDEFDDEDLAMFEAHGNKPDVSSQVTKASTTTDTNTDDPDLDVLSEMVNTKATMVDGNL